MTGTHRDGGTDTDSAGTENGAQRAVRIGVSLGAVGGFVVGFGVGSGALFVLLVHGLAAVPPVARLFEDPAARTFLLAAYALALPATSFVFLALYDDAALEPPTWSTVHPPLADVWLLLVLAYGALTLGLGTPPVPAVLVTVGLLALTTVLAVGLPLWLCRRCLRHPSWLLGVLSVLTGSLVAVIGVGTVSVLDPLTPRPVIEFLGIAAVALAGTAIPLVAARRSPGPEQLGRRASEHLDRLASRTATAARRHLGGT